MALATTCQAIPGGRADRRGVQHEPAVAPTDLNADKFNRHGIRVPALVLPPFIPAGTISRTVYDHTSILKTILNRFCKRPDGEIPFMGRRVDAAAELEPLLSLPAPRRDCKPAPNVLVGEIANVRLHLQREMLDLIQEAQRLGVPNDQL